MAARVNKEELPPISQELESLIGIEFWLCDIFTILAAQYVADKEDRYVQSELHRFAMDVIRRRCSPPK